MTDIKFGEILTDALGTESSVSRSTRTKTDCKMFRSTKGASKQRRDLINVEISQLRDLLPLAESARQRLSQLQIMSLTCVYIRKCNFFARLFGEPEIAADSPYEFSQTMTGFLIVVSRDGKLLYISENVTEYLGHSMVDMMTQGDSIYDIIDKRDHSLVQSQLVSDSPGQEQPPSKDPLQASSQPSSDPHQALRDTADKRTFFCRMNVARSFRRQAGFGDHKMMHVKGHFIQSCDPYGNQPVFMAICSPLITPDVKDSAIQNSTTSFYSVHGLDMRYTEIGHIGQHHLGYDESELVGKSWYELLHPEDLHEAKEKHIQLIKSSHEMGCMLTTRLQSKAGSWIWMNIVMHIRQPFVCDNGEPAIVCINHILEDGEAEHFRLQSQLYSSHIARSPEFLGGSASPHSALSPQHTITQVPSESRPAQPPPAYPSPSPSLHTLQSHTTAARVGTPQGTPGITQDPQPLLYTLTDFLTSCATTASLPDVGNNNNATASTLVYTAPSTTSPAPSYTQLQPAQTTLAVSHTPLSQALTPITQTTLTPVTQGLTPITQALTPITQALTPIPQTHSPVATSQSSSPQHTSPANETVLNKLKRKISVSNTSGGQCRPAKLPKILTEDNHGGSHGTANMATRYQASAVIGSLPLFEVLSGGSDGAGGTSVVSSQCGGDGPLYQQLLVVKDGLLPALCPVPEKPPTPLTPDTTASNSPGPQTSPHGALAVSVTNLPASLLTPDTSPVSAAPSPDICPASSPDQSLETSPVSEPLEVSFFEEGPRPAWAVKPTLRVVDNSPPPTQAPGADGFPELDLLSVEKMFYDLEHKGGGGSVAEVPCSCGTASSTSLSPQHHSPESPAAVPKAHTPPVFTHTPYATPHSPSPGPVAHAEHPAVEISEQQLLNQAVTNTLMDLVQRAADGSLDLTHFMLGGSGIGGEGIRPDPTLASVGAQLSDSDGADLATLTLLTSTADPQELLGDDPEQFLQQLNEMSLPPPPPYAECDLTSPSSLIV